MRRWGGLRLLAVATGLYAVACMQLAAQEQAAPSRLALAPSLEEELQWLAAEGLVIRIPTVATASRFEQQSVQAPASVAVVTRDQILKYGHRTLGDILRSVRGFNTNADGVVLTLGARGYSDPHDLNTRILILIDGHRLNESIYDVSPVDNVLPIDIAMIQRVEVLHGPASSLYGSNAFLAVINIITREGSDVNGLEVSQTFGSYDTYKSRVTYGGKMENGLELLLSATIYESRGNTPFLPAYADRARNFGYGIQNMDRDTDLMLKLSYEDWALQVVHGDRDKEDPMGTWAVIFNESVDNTDMHTYVDLAYTPILGEDWDVSWRLYYQHYAYKWRGPWDQPPPTMNVVENFAEWWGSELLVTKPLSEKHKVTAGVEYRDNFRQDFLAFDEAPNYWLYNKKHERSDVWALFVQDEYRILEQLILNAGVRWDRYSTFGNTVNPRAALIFHPLSKTIVKLLYGEAFRAPSAAEIHQNDGYSLMPNDSLEPETVRTYEAVLEQYVGDNYRVILSVFRNSIDDALISQDVGGGFSQYQNEGTLDSQGGEIELEGAWRNGVEGRIGYGYYSVEDEEAGDRPVGALRHLGKVNVIVPVWENKVFVGTEVLYVGERPTLGDLEASSYWLTNVNIFGRELVPNCEFGLSVQNVFNTHADEVGTTYQNPVTMVPQEGRTVWGTVTVRF